MSAYIAFTSRCPARTGPANMKAVDMISSKMTLAAALAGAMTLGACTQPMQPGNGDPNQRTKNGALIGAGVGALAGAISEGDGKGALKGALIGGTIGAYNAFWFDLGTNVVASRQTSLIVDPPDGRLPPLVEGATRQVGSLTRDVPGERPVRYRSGGIGLDGPEDRALAERCLLGFNSGPPMMPSGYNNNIQLFQTAEHVVILNEMVHDARSIPLDGRPHLDGIRQWMGDPRGHWDGDTLVVESRNFTNMTSSFAPGATSGLGTGDTLHLTERFTRLDEDTLLYEYTVNDPSTFTQPFTVALPMQRLDLPIFEYACHEGNYGLLNILRGAREDEAAETQP